MSFDDENRDEQSRNSAAYSALFSQGASSGRAESVMERLNRLEQNPPSYIEQPDYTRADIGTDADVNAVDEGENAQEAEAEANAREARQRGKLISPGALVVFLLKNYIDREDDKTIFESLVRQEREVEEFCRRMFLRLVIDHDSGFAYVRSLTEEEMPTDAGQRPPQLLNRRAMPFYDSLLLILLRQRLLEFDLSGQFGRLVLDRAEIITMVKSFVHNVNNDKRLEDNLDRALENLRSLGLLGRIGPAVKSKSKAERDAERIEVKRIIGVIVTPEILKQADEILASYLKHIKEGGRSKNSLTADDNAESMQSGAAE